MNRSLTRRAFAARLAASGAILAASAGTAASAAAEPDAALLALGRRFAEAFARVRDLENQVEGLLRQAAAEAPPVPAALIRQRTDPSVMAGVRLGQPYGAEAIAAFRQLLRSGGAGYFQEGDRQRACARAAEIVAAVDAWCEARLDLSERLGLDAAETELDRAGRASDALLDAIRTRPAATLAGLAVRARAAATGRDADWDDRVADAIVDDVLRIAREADHG